MAKRKIYVSFLIALCLVGSASSLLPGCVPTLLSKCSVCCAMIFSSSNCSLNDVFRVRINGNGALGALWDDSAVAVIVRDRCLLEMWDLRNQTGTHRTFGLDGLEVYNLEHYGFEKRASSVRCTCQTLPTTTTTTTEIPLTMDDDYEEESDHDEDE